MNEEKYWNLMSRYLAEDLSSEETDELLKWVDDDPSRGVLLRELRETWVKSNSYPDDFEVDTAAAWTNVKQQITGTEQQIMRSRTSFLRIVAVAASLVIVLTAGLIGYRYYTDSRYIRVEALAGEHKEVLLPDGSRVWLNSASDISYPADFEDRSQRDVQLHGEAFFEVTRNPERPFVIKTGITITRVLGTSFNVKQSKNGSVDVAVVTGKVSFGPETQQTQKFILLPGESAQYSENAGMSKSTYDNTNFLFWKSRSLSFENTSLAEVLNTIGQCYSVDFSVKDQDLLDRKITTSFDKASIEQVMDVLEVLLDLDTERSGGLYTIRKLKN